MEYKNYYDLLGIPENSDEGTIKQAYRSLALKLHPDVNPSPNSHEEFIRIGEAYEILLYKLKFEKNIKPDNNPNTVDADADRSYWEDIIREAHENARRQSEMRFEKLRKEHAAFQQSGLYDITLALRYLINIGAIFAAAGLIAVPVYVACTEEFQAFFYLFFFWIFGGFLAFYIFSNRKNWFNLGSFYFKPSVIKEYLKPRQVVDKQGCFYCKGYPADGAPFEQTLMKVNDIKFSTGGPMVQQVHYKRTYKTIEIPRSRKAFLNHLSATFIKVFSILLFAFILRPGSNIWNLILGAGAGGIFSTLLMLVSRTKPKTLFLLSPLIIIKLICWILALSLVSYQTQGWHIYATNYIYLALALLLLFLDLILDPIAKLILGKWAIMSLARLPEQEKQLLEKGYFHFQDLPFWSTIAPVFRWLI
jgi:hypothetical protein